MSYLIFFKTISFGFHKKFKSSFGRKNIDIMATIVKTGEKENKSVEAYEVILTKVNAKSNSPVSLRSNHTISVTNRIGT